MAPIRQYIATSSPFGAYLKFILLAVVMGLVIALILPPILQNTAPTLESELDSELETVLAPELAEDPTNSKNGSKTSKTKDVEKTASINNLVYEGKTENAHFKITAKSLNKETDGIDLMEPSGVLTSNNGITTTIFAKIGTYKTDKQTIVLKEGVKITSNRNTLLHSRHITINIKTNTITSHGRTIINRDGLKMEGDGATITDDNIFKLTGNVKLIQTPQG